MNKLYIRSHITALKNVIIKLGKKEELEKNIIYLLKLYFLQLLSDNLDLIADLCIKENIMYKECN